MKTYHVMAGGHEFIGECERTIGGDVTLHKVVKLTFHNTNKGLMMHMNNLQNDNNYEGTVMVHGSPIIFMQLQEMGSLVKQYRQARSNILTVQPKIEVVKH